ncbi:hypothetical protein EST62_04080 [Chlorobaculum sp. 24CR]|uniref:hypothetical protein n=1 Tax=Chlorobaculum sp. 24CR TaxID=2508878 RepID=UPI00100C1327|nr:hypothetical protein [Chlorobaculum sp. 24CR]RXK88223.1 hypothetical protein EST62_04080 [Chlorobaculum sp. 24CR]
MKIAFVDESHVYLNGEKRLLYGAYICPDLSKPSQALIEIRNKFKLSQNIEIKWTIDTGNAVLNSNIKEDLLCQSHGYGDEFLVSISRGKDKNTAFNRCLEQVYNHLKIRSEETYGVIFDHDVTPNKQKAAAHAMSFSEKPYCLLFAEAASELTAGISVIDGFLGAYAYMIHKQDIEKQPKIEAHPELYLRLDEFFWEIFRRSIPGEFRWDHSYSEYEDVAKVDTGYNHTLGHGLVVDPDLTAEQFKRIEPFIDLHLGCTI